MKRRLILIYRAHSIPAAEAIRAVYNVACPNAHAPLPMRLVVKNPDRRQFSNTDRETKRARTQFDLYKYLFNTNFEKGFI